MPLGDCPKCSLPLIPGSSDDRGPRCPNCGPVSITRRNREPAPGWRRDDDCEPPRRRWEEEDDRPRRRRRDEDEYEYEYEPRDRRRGRFVRPEGVPWYVVLVGALTLVVGALGLLGNGLIFCVGFHAEFIRNAKPDPEGVALLMAFAVAIVASLVALAAGYSMIVGRRYWLTIVGCIAAALCTHLLFLGFLVGVAALIVLLQAEARESFR
jgi:hypothetical protein